VHPVDVVFEEVVFYFVEDFGEGPGFLWKGGVEWISYCWGSDRIMRKL